MRYLASIGFGLLALILIMQMNIFGRLDNIAKRPVQTVAYAYNPPSASEVARPRALEEQPSFRFQSFGWSGGNGDPLTQIVFTMTYEAASTEIVSIKAGSGIIAQIEKEKSSDVDNDSYKITLKPEGRALPGPCTLLVSYVDHDGITGERAFDVTYDLDMNRIRVRNDPNPVEIRRQMALEEPPSFRFHPHGWTGGLGGTPLKKVSLIMARGAGPAEDVSIKVPSEINVQLEKKQPNDADYDYYDVTFKPAEDESLPTSWTFSVSYTGNGGKAGGCPFDVTYNPDSNNFAVTMETNRLLTTR